MLALPLRSTHISTFIFYISISTSMIPIQALLTLPCILGIQATVSVSFPFLVHPGLCSTEEMQAVCHQFTLSSSRFVFTSLLFLPRNTFLTLEGALHRILPTLCQTLLVYICLFPDIGTLPLDCKQAQDFPPCRHLLSLFSEFQNFSD